MRLGLIEACRNGRRPSRIRAFPRPMRLGLIEAGKPPQAIEHTGAFPRPMRLGLIEACSSSRIDERAENYFRGPCASASLKLWALALYSISGDAISEAHAPRPH